MNVLFLTQVLPYPLDAGPKVRAYYVLRHVAAEFDIEVAPAHHQRVLDEHALGVARGVVGSPHFFTAAGGFFCPALDVSRDADGRLHIAADSAGYERFLATCFGDE